MRVTSNGDPPLIETGAPEFHADGIAAVQLAAGTVKFIAYSRRVTITGEVEHREVLTVAMPVSAFPGGVAALRERWGHILQEETPALAPMN